MFRNNLEVPFSFRSFGSCATDHEESRFKGEGVMGK